ncbi:hypothetical protein ABH922_003761 [Rhodococcus sp. 27YEA15]|uniref:hypothetical protein n=1 Tax=Rhodococcus sp. 27YEA15 TaxID=3156259 RepID=UPI003C7D6C08
MPGPESTGLVELSLNDIDELFVAPDLDPMAGQFESTSGMDRAMAQARGMGQQPLTVDISVASPLDQDVEQRVRVAVQGYCRVRSAELASEIAGVKRRGRKELMFGMIFLAVCLVLAGSLELASIVPEWIQQVSTEGLVIIGWISLWHPVDMLLFERWPLVKDQRVLVRIADADFRIRSTPSRASDSVTR